MVHLLVGNGSVVLEDVVIRGSSSRHQLLESRLNEANIWLAREEVDEAINGCVTRISES